ncbi:MAG: nitrite/sulfite reductase [Betaproteobacteria bacterium]|jgi:sulfite reductase (NADPH) hemoprotein beta-component|nr:nitrite/sulfite reductase [Betaproteobacteria bacterium]
MYLYDEIDQRIVDERVRQYRDQTRRYLAGTLSEDAFRPLRLQNGLYIQRHAPMLRIAIPYGLLASYQLRKLATIARRYDRGYGHFSTRQNLQLNWVRLEDVPDILGDLATVQMHAIQTSGNCIRNITTDHFAGVAPDEIVDPLVWCEVLRQWSALNPEFAYLPRKFKIAVNGSREDRAATRVHDVGLHAVRGSGGETGFRVSVGGGLGRTPMIGHVIREFLPWQHLLTYLDAILRVYNRHGRRDNKYRARVKFLVKERGAPEFAHEIDAEWTHLKGGPATLIPEEVERIAARFVRPAYEALPARGAELEARLSTDAGFARWHGRNVHPHKVAGYAAVTVSLKRPGSAPGDVTAAEMDALAVLADRYSHGELRVTHEQNLILADVRQRDLAALWGELRALGLAVPNIGLLTNIVACPGGDFCSLANARSIPVAEAIRERFEDLDYVHDIGPLDLNISGCMNSCGHHHVGHIGILGVDKDGSEWYQISIGGSQGEHASLGKVIGPSFAQDEVADVIERLIACYLAHRDGDAERFVDTVARIGISPFKEYVYGNAHQERSRAPRQLAAA